MLNPSNTIEALNKFFRLYFERQVFLSNEKNVNRFSYKLQGGIQTSKAINNYGNTREQINAISWFDDFWIYITINFANENIFISVSVFQGNENDKKKHQLFRAEWDDYNNEEERHPQPHWHITSNQAIEKTFEEIASMDEDDSFVSLLKEEKSKIIDVNKIHFAMNADWINTGVHVHSLNTEEKIIKWFSGLLSHIKIELEYAKGKVNN